MKGVGNQQHRDHGTGRLPPQLSAFLENERAKAEHNTSKKKELPI